MGIHIAYESGSDQKSMKTVTIGCKSLCHNASMGFDSPTSN